MNAKEKLIRRSIASTLALIMFASGILGFLPQSTFVSCAATHESSQYFYKKDMINEYDPEATTIADPGFAGEWNDRIRLSSNGSYKPEKSATSTATKKDVPFSGMTGEKTLSYYPEVSVANSDGYNNSTPTIDTNMKCETELKDGRFGWIRYPCLPNKDNSLFNSVTFDISHEKPSGFVPTSGHRYFYGINIFDRNGTLKWEGKVCFQDQTGATTSDVITKRSSDTNASFEMYTYTDNHSTKAGWGPRDECYRCAFFMVDATMSSSMKASSMKISQPQWFTLGFLSTGSTIDVDKLELCTINDRHFDGTPITAKDVNPYAALTGEAYSSCLICDQLYTDAEGTNPIDKITSTGTYYGRVVPKPGKYSQAPYFREDSYKICSFQVGVETDISSLSVPNTTLIFTGNDHYASEVYETIYDGERRIRFTDFFNYTTHTDPSCSDESKITYMRDEGDYYLRIYIKDTAGQYGNHANNKYVGEKIVKVTIAPQPYEGMDPNDPNVMSYSRMLTDEEKRAAIVSTKENVAVSRSFNVDAPYYLFGKPFSLAIDNLNINALKLNKRQLYPQSLDGDCTGDIAPLIESGSGNMYFLAQSPWGTAQYLKDSESDYYWNTLSAGIRYFFDPTGIYQYQKSYLTTYDQGGTATEGENIIFGDTTIFSRYNDAEAVATNPKSSDTEYFGSNNITIPSYTELIAIASDKNGASASTREALTKWTSNANNTAIWSRSIYNENRAYAIETSGQISHTHSLNEVLGILPAVILQKQKGLFERPALESPNTVTTNSTLLEYHPEDYHKNEANGSKFTVYGKTTTNNTNVFGKGFASHINLKRLKNIRAGRTYKVYYKGAEGGTNNTFLSAMIYNRAGNLLFENRIAKITSETGYGELTIPETLEENTEYTLIICEERISPKYTTNMLSPFENGRAVFVLNEGGSATTQLKDENMTAVLDQSSYTFTGEEIHPSIQSVSCSGEEMTTDDYTVSYENAVNAGIGYIVITAAEGSTKFEGSAKIPFSITAIDASEAAELITADDHALTSGNYQTDGVTPPAIDPSNVSFAYGSYTLQIGDDYQIRTPDPIGIGLNTITYDFDAGTNGNFTGQRTYNILVRYEKPSGSTLDITVNEDGTVVINTIGDSNEDKTKLYDLLQSDGVHGVVIGENVTSGLNGGVFAGLSNITEITVDKNNSVYASKENCLYSKDLTNLIAVPSGKDLANSESSDAVLNGVKRIEDRAFDGNTSLVAVNIPETVEFIGNHVFGDPKEAQNGGVIISLPAGEKKTFCDQVESGTSLSIYEGTGQITVREHSISGAEVVLEDVPEEGWQISSRGTKPKPNVISVTLTSGSRRVLDADEDYTVDYSYDLPNLFGYVTVTGKSPYAGSVQVPFDIAPANTTIIQQTNYITTTSNQYGIKDEQTGEDTGITFDPNSVNRIATETIKNEKNTDHLTSNTLIDVVVTKDVSDEEKEQVENAADYLGFEGVKEYYDIQVIATDQDGTEHKLTQLSNSIVLSVNGGDGIDGKEFAVLRAHKIEGGEYSYSQVSDIVDDPSNMQFASSQFSGYGIAYRNQTEKGDTPKSVQITNVTKNGFSLSSAGNVEYSIDGVTWQESGDFSGLHAGTSYTVLVRTKASSGGSTRASDPLSLVVTTLQDSGENTSNVAEPPAYLVISNLNKTSFVANAPEGTEFSIDGGRTWQDSGTFTGLAQGTVYTVMGRTKANGQKKESSVVSAFVMTTQDNSQPTIISGGGGGGTSVTNVITNQLQPKFLAIDEVTETSFVALSENGVEYSIDGGKTWSTSGIFTGLTPNTLYTVMARIPKNDSKEASAVISSFVLTKSSEEQKHEEESSETKEKMRSPGYLRFEDVTAYSFTAISEDGVEFSIDGGKTWNSSGIFNNCTAETSYDVMARFPASNGKAASDPIFGSLTTSKKPYTVIVTFDSIGGTKIASQKIIAGSSAEKPKNPSRKGAKFVGWCKDKACSKYFDFDSPVTKNITLYAKWDINEYKNTLQMNGKFKVRCTGKKVTAEWGKVPYATHYNIYITYCGLNTPKKAAKTTNAKTLKAKFTKINGKAINRKKNVKVRVDAYQKVGGKNIRLASTIIAHVVGNKNSKYTNPKSVTILSKKTISLKTKETSRIKARVNLVHKKKKSLGNSHAKKFRYKSSDNKIASVSSNGVVTAKSKGTCFIWVYARNGCAKKVKIIVK